MLEQERGNSCCVSYKTSVREVPRTLLQMLQCRGMRRCGMAQTDGSAAGRCSFTIPGLTPVQSSPVQFSLIQSSVPKRVIPEPWYSLLSDCVAVPQCLPSNSVRPVPVPLASCSGKIHYSPGESCSALSLRRVYAAAGSIFTLEIRTTPSLSCKHI